MTNEIIRIDGFNVGIKLGVKFIRLGWKQRVIEILKSKLNTQSYMSNR